MRSIPLVAAAAAVLLTTPSALPAQADGAAQWRAFGERIVGTWESGDSRHEVEWGVGELLIKSRSYFGAPGRWRLVSEGIWYWDPTSGAIRGITVAQEMPVTLFEYTSSIDGSTVVHALVTHGEMGGRYEERWSFVSDGYTWELRQEGARIAGGSYRRVR